MKGKANNIIHKIISVIITPFCLIFSICLITSVLSAYINPNSFGLFPFFGLAFWPFLIINILLFILLLFFRSKKVFIQIIALAIAIPGITKSISYHPNNEEGHFKLMSYNLHNFYNVYDEESCFDAACKIIDFIKSENPDFVCLQEFKKYNKTIDEDIIHFANQTGFDYFEYDVSPSNKKKANGGRLILSKYPIKIVESFKSLNKRNLGFIVLIETEKPFYLASVHLASFQLKNEELSIFDNVESENIDKKIAGKSILKKLHTGFNERSKEVEFLTDKLPKDSLPIIVCGDFNDTPLSYTYQKMIEHQFHDFFVDKGNGIGTTYTETLPMLRIDYIWHKNGIIPKHFKTVKLKISDHYPIFSEFNLN